MSIQDMTDDEVLELLKNPNARIEMVDTKYQLIVTHADIPRDQLTRLYVSGKIQTVCNGAPVWRISDG